MNRLLIAALPAVWLGMLYIAYQGAGRWPLIGLGLISLVLVGVLGKRTGNIANRTNSQADEFQRGRRDSAHRLAYWWLSAPVGAALGLGVGLFEKLHRKGEPLVISIDQLPVVGVVLWGMLLAWLCLPSVILALSGPRPLEELA
jgi:hypothetical protein